MLKFGFRHKNFYPLMLLLFIFLRIVADKILKLHPYGDNIDFIIPFLIFFSQSLIGFIIYLYYSKKSSSSKTSDLTPIRIGTIELILNKSYISNDSKKKIILLVISASFFDFIGCIIRNNDVINFGKKEENNSRLEVRVRSFQIIFSSLLCYYTIRLNIYNHQKVSLITLSCFLVIIIILELVISVDMINKIIALLICSMSCLSRSFLDVTEKYLFEFNYINLFLMISFEGLIGLVLYILFFISNNEHQKQAKNLLINMSDFNWDSISFILLIILYIIISGFRNAYRVTTNKYYSPMSRALFESTLDPFLFLYYFLMFDEKDNVLNWAYFSVVIFCLIVIAFFSLVYNDFIILYCCGLEHNTYKGIINRLYTQQINKVTNIIVDNENSSVFYEESEDNDTNIDINMDK